MNRIAELRKAQNMSQKQFSRLLNVAQNTISQWETEQRDIDSSTLLKISEYFGVTTDYLLGRTDDPTPPQKEKAPSRHEGVCRCCRGKKLVIFPLTTPATLDQTA